jgi:cytochrome b561
MGHSVAPYRSREETQDTMHSATTDRYSPLQMVLHWATLFLVIAIYAAILWRGELPKGEPLRDVLRDWHRQLALIVLALTALRLLVRAVAPTPPIVPPLPAWQSLASRAVHVALYLFLIVMPLLGLVMSAAAGVTVTFFGVPLPSLIGVDKPLAHTLAEGHETIGTIGYGLIGVHAAAALFHHFVRRDTTLRRMLPGSAIDRRSPAAARAAGRPRM